MADTLKPTYPLAITFTDGELPDARKLTAVASQSKNGQAILASALGDPWNQGGDSFLALAGNARALMMPNLARYCGEAAAISPYFLAGGGTVTTYTHMVLADDVGKHEFQLSVAPDTTMPFTFAGTGAPTNSVASRGMILNPGDYWIDGYLGIIYTYDSVVADWRVEYTPLTTALSELGFNYSNVIPDPSTESSWDFQGCKIAYANNVNNTSGYIIFLPPRGPQTRTLTRSPQSRYDLNTYNESPDTTAASVYFWQDPSLAAATTSPYDEVYRYILPSWITSYWSSGSTLPEGVAYLWDYSQTKTIIEEVTLRAETAATPRKYVLVASGTALDNWISTYMASAYAACGGLAALTQRDVHTAIYYPSTGLRLIVTSISLSQMVAQLAYRLLNHDHSAPVQHPDCAVNHSKLLNLYDPATSPDATNQPIFASQWDGDDHPQYLHRTGVSGVTNRDPYHGGMFGDILLLSTNSGTDYRNVLANSRRIWFGDDSYGSPFFGWNFDATTSYSGLMAQTDFVTDSFLLNSLGIATPGYGPFLNFRNLAGAGALGSIGLDGDGSFFIEDPITYSRASTQGGSLKCNRYYSGSYNDPSYGLDTGYGPVRHYIVTPDKWIFFSATGAFDDTSVTESALDVRVWDFSTRFDALIPLAPRGASGNPAIFSYAWAYLDIPFLQYEIVNVGCSVEPTGANLTAAIWYASLGYQAQPGNPSGTIIVGELDISTLGSGGSAWLNTIDGHWTSYQTFFTAGTCNLEIDHSDAGFIGGMRYPWVSFRASEASGVPDLAIGMTIVYYRVKEF